MTLTIHTNHQGTQTIIHFSLGACDSYLHVVCNDKVKQPDVYSVNAAKASEVIEQHGLTIVQLEHSPPTEQHKKSKKAEEEHKEDKPPYDGPKPEPEPKA